MNKIKIILFVIFNSLILQISNCQSSIQSISFGEIIKLARIDPELASIHASKKLIQAKSRQSKNEIAEAYSLLALISMIQSFPDEGKLLSDTALSYSIEIDNELLNAFNYSTKGSCYQNQGDYATAVNFYNKSLDIALTKGYQREISSCLRSLAKISSIQGNHDKSLQYLEKLKNEISVFEDKREQALLYISYGEYYGYIGKVDSALLNNNKAYIICKQNNISQLQAWSQALMAINYAETDLNKSLEFMLEAQSIFDTLSSKSVYSITNLGNIGEVFKMFATDEKLLKTFNVQGFDKSKTSLLRVSEKYLLRGLALSKEKKSKLDIITASGNLANFHAYNGDYKSAYEYYTVYHNLSDSLYSQKNKNAIAKLESENEIITLQTKNQKKTWINLILLLLISGVLAIGYILNRSYKQKQKLQLLKINELENEKKIEAADYLIKGQQEERSRIAKDLHDGLGGMLNGIKYSINNMKGNLTMSYDDSILFEKSIGQLDNVIKELRRVSHNLMPDALLKLSLQDAVIDYINTAQTEDSKITFQIMGNVRPLSNNENLHIYRIIQELITNSIKHGVAKNILIQMTYTNEKILIDIDDDGNGFNVNESNEKGIGLKNIAQRIEYLKGNINIQSNPRLGTSVNIELKI